MLVVMAKVTSRIHAVLVQVMAILVGNSTTGTDGARVWKVNMISITAPRKGSMKQRFWLFYTAHAAVL